MTDLPGRLSRRSILRLGAAAILALLSGGTWHVVGQQHLLAARLRALLPHHAAAAIVGAAYLARAPGEESGERLLMALVADWPGDVSRLTERQLVSMLAQGIRDDFAAGRTVSVHGWIVSVTEARLAAMVVVG